MAKKNVNKEITTKNGKTAVKKQPVSKPKTTKKRKPHATRPTSEDKVRIGKRRDLVVDLTTKGLSIRKISTHLKSKGFDEASPTTVFTDLQTELEESASRRSDKIEILRENELNKLDNWEFDLNLQLNKLQTHPELVAASGERVKIYNTLIRIQNQRDRFSCISKAQKSEDNAREALAKLLGVSVDELPDDGEK